MVFNEVGTKAEIKSPNDHNQIEVSNGVNARKHVDIEEIKHRCKRVSKDLD